MGMRQTASSRPVTNYLGDIPISTSQSFHSPETGSPPGSPSDSELERAVRNILRDADLNTVTKKQIRKRLEDMFGVDLLNRKAGINAMVDRIVLAES
jgi:chitin synthase